MNINHIKTPWRTAAGLLLLGTASLMADAGVRHVLSFDVSALSVETVTMPDGAAALRAYLKDEYNMYKANGAFFCLIAGDTETTMPYRMTWLYSNTPGISTDFENIYIPTDNYFGDLTSAWNLVKDGNGIYGTYYKNLTYRAQSGSVRNHQDFRQFSDIEWR